jgi:transposase
MKPENFIGIDVSKYWLDFAVVGKNFPAALRLKFNNDERGLRSFREALKSHGVSLNRKTTVVLEHSGHYQTKLLTFLNTKKCFTCVDSALRIKKSIGINRGKNDVVDAERIAHYAYKNYQSLRQWIQPSETLTLLKTLLSNRERLLTIKNNLNVPTKEIKQSCDNKLYRVIQQINSGASAAVSESIKMLELEVDKAIKRDSSIKRQVDLLKSVPGIGKIISVLLVCYTNEFTLFSSAKKLACYCGVVPFQYHSGLHVRGQGHVSKMANHRLKKHLHLSAMAVIRTKTDLSKYYKRKTKEGKNKMLVLNNVKNRIIMRAFAVVKRGEPYKRVFKRNKQRADNN